MMIYGSIVTSIIGPVKEKQYNKYFIDKQEQAPGIFCIFVHLSAHTVVHVLVTQISVHIGVEAFQFMCRVKSTWQLSLLGEPFLSYFA